ncbi:MAG TPA: bifunctional phosphoribosylaminoimidazolecarboxamide formyltransferase/IMP cyclohydrolase [Candidatus Methylomirabilis sp.]|nr:bifunctional phosphoribosylaminoimidazolecarboxamide formyltransferase/IMP cyclohydrolase [Candidatus Methylomirabilis sp.]
MQKGRLRIRRALLSVSDKAGLVEFAAGLSTHGAELISTGKTAAHLRSAGISVTDVAAVTGSPDLLHGRVKTLHPAIHAAILARRGDPDHERELERHGIAPIDLVAVNLYPFEATIGTAPVELDRATEQIDVGGPTLVRSAAKNFEGVAIVTDPAQYAEILEELRRDGGLSLETRLRLAQAAFRLTARYEGVIASFLSAVSCRGAALEPEWPQLFPPFLALGLERVQLLRYGENPHQRGALYRDAGARGPWLAHARKLQGKDLSYTNLLDLDAALHLSLEFTAPAACIIKHTTPCGVALADTLLEAYRRAYRTDPTSAYGGVVGLNRAVDEMTAKEIVSTFVEAVIAPEYTEAAREVLRPRTNLRLMQLPAAAWPPSPDPREVRGVSGGLLVQERDRIDTDPSTLKVVSKREPTPAEWAALAFAFKVVKHVKSNAVVFTTATATVGIGAGQMSRVDACRTAIGKAHAPLIGTVVASDAFFPFRDGIDVVAEAGATAIIQPGGSVRDAEAVQAADEHGMAMVFTGIRHFRH